jgi:heme oxygenase
MSLTLKEQTKEQHNNIEGSEFAEILLGGRISPALYHAYLSAQYECYKALENIVGLPEDLQSIFRAPLIMEDMIELERQYELDEIETTLKTVKHYISYINGLAYCGEKDRILAHLYVRHFGDLHGGQVIKRRVPGSGLMYEFVNRKGLIIEVRKLLNNEMGDEAKTCFRMVEDIFDELIEGFDEAQYEVDDL